MAEHRMVSPERLLELRALIDGGAKEGAEYILSCREMEQLLDHIDTLEEALDEWRRVDGLPMAGGAHA